MKMQEVIVRLREIAPGVAINVEAARDTFAQLKLVISDALRANSVESVRALLKACDEKAVQIDLALKAAGNMATRLRELNESYKEKLGPRAKKSGDDPRQMELDLFAGRSTFNGAGTSDTSRKCPRCKASALGCEFCDNGMCKGVVYPTNPPQYDPCVFCSLEARQ